MAKITSSGDRSKRKATKPVTQGQNPQRANRQAASKATVSQSGGGTPGSAKVTTSGGKPIGTGGGGITKPSGAPKMVNANKPTMQRLVRKAAQVRKAGAGRPLVKPVEAQRLMTQRVPRIREGAQRLRTIGDNGRVRDAQKQGQQIRQAAQARRGARGAMKAMEGTLKAARTARNIAGAAKNLAKGGAAAVVMSPTALADGTLTAAQSGRAPSRFGNARDLAMKKAKAIKGSKVVGPKKSAAGQFDSAFAAARKAGKSTFTWRGKKYTTEKK